MPVNVKSEEDGRGSGAQQPPARRQPVHAPSAAFMDIDAASSSHDSLHPIITHDVRSEAHDNDDDDDSIVREVDVYLSPALADQIYLLQYPLQQTQLHRLPTAARIKPRHAQLELEHPIPVANNAGAGQGGGGGSGSGYCRGAFPFMTRRIFESHTIPVETHMCLGQLKVDPDDYTKTSLHLVPLQHISQMRPSFRHVEENTDDNIDNTADGAPGQPDHNKDDDHHHHDDHDDGHHTNNNNFETAEKKPIVFQRKESERAAMIRKSSYAYKKASHDAEEWQDLIVCDSTSAEYTTNLNKIVVVVSSSTTTTTFANNPQQQQAIWAPMHKNDDNDDNDGNDYNDNQDWTTPADMNYIQSLNYVKVSTQEDMLSASATTSGAAAAAAAAASSGSNSNNSSSSIHDIKSIIARMTVLLGNGGPIPYSILRDQFVTSSSSSSTVSDAKLFQALSICAVLVRGNFCLHSKFLSLSKSMQRARTFLLLLFQKYQTVQKSRLCQMDLQLLLLEDITNTTNNSNNSAQQQQQQQQVVTLDKLHVLLQQVGKRTNAVVNAVDYNHNHRTTATNNAGWVLRVEDNLAFVAAHPEEAAQHLTYWNRLSTSSSRFKKLLEQYNNAATTANNEK